ncbi:sulfurtransferase [Arthrobacter sp. zg-Y1171]|uniref:sulfurtransferase n=1 Tax=Arthrobacter sp. zg-Y1171 TaxID=2964610 RepID=UPI002103996D|nr:sulfurtransferase [Arthrobacter sp. zg-Y1171]MCQ1995009.1 sulfurtransferase [Arthrobacter sp. zg-Y1171]UWX80939.1 sulfurtransferase [Arthrobacter sp. zg-Y1171]
MDVLISPHQLHERLGTARRPVLLDVRWVLGAADGEEKYLHEHLPGAVYVDMDTELSAPAVPAEGRHPLPDPAAFAAAARSWGLNDGDTVVVYDDAGGTAAARAWWLLRHAGCQDVFLLDGGLAAWRRAGLPLESGPVEPLPGTAHLSWGHMPVASLRDVSRVAAEGILIDARAPERYRGETEPVDPRAGHIPGAVNRPSTDNLAPDGSFRSPGELGRAFEDLGVRPDRPVAAYCGSGIFASHEVAALAQAGITAALYPGSWSQWSNTPGTPAAVGPDPGKAENPPQKG